MKELTREELTQVAGGWGGGCRKCGPRAIVKQSNQHVSSGYSFESLSVNYHKENFQTYHNVSNTQAVYKY
ncbi:MAG: hypothetical protein ACPGWR_31970 [Ardenticatenaceae bacterium]